jgi:hypothetical protein
VIATVFTVRDIQQLLHIAYEFSLSSSRAAGANLATGFGPQPVSVGHHECFAGDVGKKALRAIGIARPRGGECRTLFRSVRQECDPALHTQRTFEFTVKLPMEAAAPLFGADKERAWAPGWNPKFIWPANATDQQGMVFTIAHGQKTIIWLTPTYDLAAGLIQYAYVIPDVMATLITVKLTPRDQWTHVVVQYERTALNAAARDVVLQMAEHDSKSGPEWETQISDYLGTLPK